MWSHDYCQIVKAISTRKKKQKIINWKDDKWLVYNESGSLYIVRKRNNYVEKKRLRLDGSKDSIESQNSNFPQLRVKRLKDTQTLAKLELSVMASWSTFWQWQVNGGMHMWIVRMFTLYSYIVNSKEQNRIPIEHFFNYISQFIWVGTCMRYYS